MCAEGDSNKPDSPRRIKKNQSENLLGDMVQDAQKLLLVTKKANVGIS
jgi:hypothetical protein